MGIDWKLLFSCLVQGFFQGMGFIGALLLVAWCLKISGIVK